MTPKKTSRTTGQLQLQRFRLTLTAARLQELVARTVETQPLLNDSFLTETPRGELRLVGLHQFGDIVLRQTWNQGAAALTLESRQGDRALVACLTTALAPHLHKVKPTIGYDFLPFENLAQFLQSLRKSPLARQLVIADSALDSALTCTGEDFAEVLEGLTFLKDLTQHSLRPGTLEPAQRRLLDMLHRRHRRPFITLHEDKKLYLSYRLEIPSPQSNATLRLHFAPLPRKRYLIGYADETSHEF